MKKFLPIILTIFLVSGYIFPFAFTFFPSQNTKNLLAAAGMAIYGFELLFRRKRLSVTKGTLLVFIAAFAVSFMALFTMLYHNTSDSTYVTYPFSLILWLCSGYTCIRAMKAVHGYSSVSLVTQYFAAVAVMQCTIALLIDYFPPFENWVNSWMAMGREYWAKTGRMYGVGCGLDVAGVRFSGILLMLSHLCHEAAAERKRKKLIIGLLCFVYVTVVGNMIARTTIIGVGASFALWMLLGMVPSKKSFSDASVLWGWIVLIIVSFYLLCSALYSSNEKMRENLRFGFEGFFSMVEKGHWETHSNNELKEMVVWPDNPGTWILGDGYMLDPAAVEDYLIKNDVAADYDYMGTDIGYCRFIFYFGIVGLAVFIIYFAVAAAACGARAPSKRICFFFLWLINMAVWAKVSTDIFAVLCIFLLTDIETDEDEGEDESMLPEEEAIA